jgi:hypothetical protein
VWHGHMRIADTIAKFGQPAAEMRLTLKAVYRRATHPAVSMAQIQDALAAWIVTRVVPGV